MNPITISPSLLAKFGVLAGLEPDPSCGFCYENQELNDMALGLFFRASFGIHLTPEDAKAVRCAGECFGMQAMLIAAMHGMNRNLQRIDQNSYATPNMFSGSYSGVLDVYRTLKSAMGSSCI